MSKRPARKPSVKSWALGVGDYLVLLAKGAPGCWLRNAHACLCMAPLSCGGRETNPLFCVVTLEWSDSSGVLHPSGS